MTTLYNSLEFLYFYAKSEYAMENFYRKEKMYQILNLNLLRNQQYLNSYNNFKIKRKPLHKDSFWLDQIVILFRMAIQMRINFHTVKYRAIPRLLAELWYFPNWIAPKHSEQIGVLMSRKLLPCSYYCIYIFQLG